MGRRARILAAVAAVGAASSALACGETDVQTQIPAKSPVYEGAVLFANHCSGCHSLKFAGAIGSATRVRDREVVDGPDFNVRRETVATTLYAIRNGGFSGAIMPQNVVTGQQAQQIARFLAAYSGRLASTPPAPSSTPTQSPRGSGSGGSVTSPSTGAQSPGISGGGSGGG